MTVKSGYICKFPLPSKLLSASGELRSNYEQSNHDNPHRTYQIKANKTDIFTLPSNFIPSILTLTAYP